MSGERSWNQGVPSLLLTSVNVHLFAAGDSFPASFSFSTEILLLRDQYVQVSKWSALQRNSSFQKLFSLPAEEFLINDFEVCMCYQEQN
jgi:hypothetical protein